MNIIRFRAWDGKRMYQPAIIDGKEWHLLEDRPIAGYPLMQFTGKIDQLGLFIFDGDIISVGWESGRENVLVGWSYQDAAWGYVYYLDDNDFVSFCHPIDEGQFPDWSTFKVVGNKYQNPELLKKNTHDT